MKRDLQCAVAPELFPYIRGATSSETLFYLALTYGLEQDPLGAMQRVAGDVERLRSHYKIEMPAFLTLAFTDGRTIYALRYASNHDSKTLFYSRNLRAIHELNGDYEAIPEGGHILVSEPLDDLSDDWALVPEATFLIMEDGNVSMLPFEPV